ncbi:MAG: radical SAM protein [Chloroflexi bacterium]|nr:radical SAM protein [Chloroflexota bacterium]
MKLTDLIPRFFPHKKEQTQPAQRPFRVAQIETTTLCHMDCIFCVQTQLAGSLQRGEMPLSLYREYIVPCLSEFELVYLQGWGEPILPPDLWEMVRLAKEKGCRTGFTTNGKLLDEKAAHQILESGLNLISISFSGATRATHQSTRVNSDWDLLRRNVERLADLKAKGGYTDLWIEIHYLMMADNLHELPEFVRLSAELGADEAVATNLTYTPNLALDQMRAFSDRMDAHKEAILSRARRTAQRTGIRLNIYPLVMESQVLVCDANPLDTVFINHRGEVAPCVLMGLTLDGDIPRDFLGQPHPTPAVRFGDVRQGLEKVMNGKARQEFIEIFQRRNISSDPLAAFAYLSGDQEEELLPDPPLPCRHCYKMYGV